MIIMKNDNHDIFMNIIFYDIMKGLGKGIGGQKISFDQN